MSDTITTSFDEPKGIARIRLTRPAKRNALTRQMLEELVAAVQCISERTEARVCVLAADGPVFCAGMDLDEMRQRATSPVAVAEWQRDSEVYAELLETLFGLRMPTVAAVQGPALAGGVGIVLACDITVAAQSAFFSLPEPARGITAAMVTPLLIQRVSIGAARLLLLSMERCSAEQALRIGLVHDVVADGELETRVSHLAQAVLSGAPGALAVTKSHLAKCAGMDVRTLLRDSMDVSAAERGTDDAREGMQAFLEKRKPRWQPVE